MTDNKDELTIRQIHTKRIEAEDEVKRIMRDFFEYIKNESLNIDIYIRPTGYDPNPSSVDFEIKLEISY